MRKHKLFNKGDSILFVDSTSIEVSQDINKNQGNQEQSTGRSKVS